MQNKCYKCKKCYRHWGGEYGENNAIECCKFKDWTQILEERDYYKDSRCLMCEEIIIKDAE